ncbi:hypothetical protein Salat_2514900 [Sesamum alatum]|uniref:Uncharacterized protein n=1 Tax=Sesamum alatum TaxID=300844 RepID=A0AAE1XSP3_9LAMI|nr:hypothetical protein Salat_2514900 [Sesamum alatum]
MEGRRRNGGEIYRRKGIQERAFVNGAVDSYHPHESNGVVLVETEDDDSIYLAREDVEPEIIAEGVLNKINEGEDASANDDDDTLIQYCDDDDDDVHNLQNEIEDD